MDVWFEAQLIRGGGCCWVVDPIVVKVLLWCGEVERELGSGKVLIRGRESRRQAGRQVKALERDIC